MMDGGGEEGRLREESGYIVVGKLISEKEPSWRTRRIRDGRTAPKSKSKLGGLGRKPKINWEKWTPRARGDTRFIQ